VVLEVIMLRKLIKYLKDKEIENTYCDFTMFGYYGLSKKQHEYMKYQCKLMGITINNNLN